MSGQLDGMVTIVTGASRGLGKAIANGYAREGAKVVVTSRPSSPTGLSGTAEETASEIRDSGGEALGIACDVTNEDQVKSMVKLVLEQYGKIDVLVNNAGIMVLNELFLDIDPERWDNLMAVNLKGPYLCCRYVLPVMIEQRSGSLVNIGSRMGAVVTEAGGTAYSSSKAGFHMFGFILAQEMRQHNIAVNAISPGSLKSEGSWSSSWGKSTWDNRIELEDVVPSAVFLAMQRPDTMTGELVSRDDFGRTWGPGLTPGFK